VDSAPSLAPSGESTKLAHAIVVVRLSDDDPSFIVLTETKFSFVFLLLLQVHVAHPFPAIDQLVASYLICHVT
jgi:hypothetical protein